MQFILTIDTEGDNQWDHGRNLTVENIKYVPRFQGLCDRYSIKPTYLVTSEICSDEYSKNLFREYISGNRAEVGAHLHSWTTHPFADVDGFRLNDRYHVYAHELPEHLLYEKIKNLTVEIEQAFGVRPRSFRSGRYGFNENVAKALIDNQYLVDSSVTPYVDWSVHKGLPGGKGGADFMNYGPPSFRYSFNNSSLLEIPITILPTRYPLNSSERLARYYFRKVDHSIALRTARKLCYKHQPLWLRPNLWMSNRLFIELTDEAERLKVPHLVMMFHSSELMPGCSVYWKDEEEIGKLYSMLEEFFILLNNRKISSATLTEAAKEFDE